MKRNKYILISTILIVIFLILGFFYARTQNTTSVELKNIRNAKDTEKVVYVNEKYYYFDAEKSGIFSHSVENGERKIIDAANVKGVTANEKSLFYICNGYLYQYHFKNETICRNQIGKDGIQKIEGLYADDKYVFVEKENDLFVFSAKDICKKVDSSSGQWKYNLTEYSVWEDINEFQMIREDDLLTYMVSIKTYTNGNMSNMPEIEETESYMRIGFKDEVTETKIFTIVNSVTGEKVYGRNQYLGRYDGNMLELMNNLIFYKENVSMLENDGIFYEDSGDYSLECEAIYDNHLIIVASSYDGSDFVLNTGTLAEHESDNLWYVDLENKETLKNYCFDKGEIVWYADTDRYILFNKGEMITYNAETQEELCRNKAEWFDKDSGYQYEVVLCHDKWFIFNEDTLVDVVAMEEYLK